MNIIKDKIKNIEYVDEKIRFLLFVFFLFFVLFLARYLLGMAYSRYEVRTKINSNIDKALYIFEDEKLSFNLEPDGIIPSNEPYTYRFSISNHNASKQSDVDIAYNVSLRTTTNLPITIQLYRNELPSTPGASNVLQGAVTAQDEDNAWYRIYNCNSQYQMNYVDEVTDYYTIVIHFPASYSSNLNYANYIESIEVIIDSNQII